MQRLYASQRTPHIHQIKSSSLKTAPNQPLYPPRCLTSPSSNTHARGLPSSLPLPPPLREGSSYETTPNDGYSPYPPSLHNTQVSLTTSTETKIQGGWLDDYSSARSGARSWSSATIWPRGKGSRPRRPGMPTAVARTNRRAPMVNAKIHWNWKRCGRVRNWPTPVAIPHVSIFSKNRRQM
jgi:hypothetical protein